MKRPVFITIMVGLIFLACSTGSRVPEGAALKVNDTWIKKADIEQTAEMLRQQMVRFNPQEGILGVSDEIRKRTAKQLVAQELVLAEARRRNIGVAEGLIDSLASMYRQQFGGDSAFAGILAQSGQSVEDFRSQLREGIQVDSVMKSMMGTPDTVSQAECREFYQGNTEKFKEGGKVRARHILIASGKDTTAAARQKLRLKAQSIAAEARSGKEFSALAKRHSADPTARDGGDIGWFKRGDLMADLENPLFALNKGGITDVIETSAGFHILQKADVQDSVTLPFEQVEWKIRRNLAMLKEQTRMEQVVDSLVASTKIVFADTSYRF